MCLLPGHWDETIQIQMEMGEPERNLISNHMIGYKTKNKIYLLTNTVIEIIISIIWIIFEEELKSCLYHYAGKLEYNVKEIRCYLAMQLVLPVRKLRPKKENKLFSRLQSKRVAEASSF